MPLKQFRIYNYGTGLRVCKMDLILRCDNKKMFDTLRFKLIKALIICPLEFYLLQHLNQFDISTHQRIQNSLILRICLILTLSTPRISESCVKIKVKLNFYFLTSLWSLKTFYEGL